MKESTSDMIVAGLMIWGFASTLSSWIYCIASDSWGILIAGALFPPIAALHGTGLWFGLW